MEQAAPAQVEGAFVLAAGEGSEGQSAGAAVERSLDDVLRLGEDDLRWRVVGFQPYRLVGVAGMPVAPAVPGGSDRAGQRIGGQLTQQFATPRLRRVGSVAIADHQHAVVEQVFVVFENPKSVTAPPYGNIDKIWPHPACRADGRDPFKAEHHDRSGRFR
ncbi:hypothetical protein [Amycolatopsis sp. NPDC004169]|uniref:hypothetical protein n=1 Tax=Amycolatopsis sp. NPDC004169 TaxID=3154453 RepID=UPI0033BBE3E2